MFQKHSKLPLAKQVLMTPNDTEVCFMEVFFFFTVTFGDQKKKKAKVFS